MLPPTSPLLTASLNGIFCGVFAGLIVGLDTQRIIWGNAASFCRDHGTLPHPVEHSPDSQALYGPKTRQASAMLWNRVVDETFGRAATELAQRGV
jgi:hypothetical protein